MEIINYTSNFLGLIAGMLCVTIIVISVYNILKGDEQEYKKYITRIKYAIIAIVLIISISQIKDIILKYFPYVESYDAIGDFSNIKISLSNGAITEEYKDIDNRNVIKVEGNYYVNTGEKLIKIGNVWEPYKIWCSEEPDTQHRRIKYVYIYRKARRPYRAV